MINLIETLNYRCLRYISRPLLPFNVLVGPNASGKTTFLDTISFLGNLVSDDIEGALKDRSENFDDLLWKRSGTFFELAVEAVLPGNVIALYNSKQRYDAIRYEIRIGYNSDDDKIEILAEKVTIKSVRNFKERERQQRLAFPESSKPPASIISSGNRKETRTIVNKVPGRNDNFYSEVHPEGGKGWTPSFKLGPRKSALKNMPDDETKFPATTWFRRLLTEGVQKMVLNSLIIKRASPPGQGKLFKPDGSNLPWVIENFKVKSLKVFEEWIGHLQTALPEIKDIKTIERQDDKHRYLVVCYQNGTEIPSWMISDGTLRLIALTLPAYLTDFKGIYLIEEPENGIHPRAVETMFQSLSSVYDAQILLATHSPVILSLVEAGNVLCFAKTDEGATDIVTGDQHPALKEWRGETNLGTLFASGVLG
jgi:predicted ATPase